MYYTKNLLQKTERSTKAIIYGFAMSAFAIAWIVSQLINKASINAFNWIFFLAFVINGISILIKGYGYSIAGILGKAHVIVNDSHITIKASAFEPENSVLWKNIESIEYKPTRFRISKKDGSEQRLCMRKLDFETIQEMKQSVELAAREKEIQYNTL